MSTARLVPPLKFKGTNANGAALVGGKLYTYITGTSTPLPTYQDIAKAVVNTNPVILDSAGEAIVMLDTDYTYRLELRSAADELIYLMDGVVAEPVEGATGAKGLDGSSASYFEKIQFTAQTAGTSHGGGCRVGNKLYLAPGWFVSSPSGALVIYDMETGITNTIQVREPSTTINKFACLGAYHLNGSVYMPVYDNSETSATQYVIKVDTSDDSVSYLLTNGGNASAKYWAGGVVVGDKLYLVPDSTGICCVIDTANNDAMTYIDLSLGGVTSAKAFSGGVVVGDFIYFGSTSNKIAKLQISTGTVTHITTDGTDAELVNLRHPAYSVVGNKLLFPIWGKTKMAVLALSTGTVSTLDISGNVDATENFVGGFKVNNEVWFFTYGYGAGVRAKILMIDSDLSTARAVTLDVTQHVGLKRGGNSVFADSTHFYILPAKDEFRPDVLRTIVKIRHFDPSIDGLSAQRS